VKELLEDKETVNAEIADHILASCPLYHPPNGTLGLTALGGGTVDWLQTTELCI